MSASSCCLKNIGLFTVLVLLLAGNARASDSLRVSAGGATGNLTLFLVHGRSAVHHPYITLQQALAHGRVTIHENNSQSLLIENRSDSDLFIQSTEIIKGGQQDRMIARDRIIPAHTMSSDLETYCVERLRSFKRGDEPIERFSSSSFLAPDPHMGVIAHHELTAQLLGTSVGGATAPDSSRLKLSALLGGISASTNPFENVYQESIWHDVAKVQSNLTTKLGDSVTKNESPSSLELALEHRSVRRTREKLRDAIDDQMEDMLRDTTVIGIIYAVGSEIEGGHLYGSHELFLALWAKIRDAMLTESLTRSGTGLSNVAPTVDEVAAYLEQAPRGKRAEEKVDARVTTSVIQTRTSYLFETRDAAASDWLHRTYTKP